MIFANGIRRWACRLSTPGLLAVLLVTSVGCSNDKAVIAQAGQFHTQLQPAVMQDAQLSDYIQRVGDRIIVAAKEMDAAGYGPKSHKSEEDGWMFSDKMKFHFVNSKTLNAFTTGGEHMYIYNELFQTCKTEDELAAVMAHEYGHVYARHVHKGMNRQMALMLGAGAVGAVGYAAGGSENGQTYATYGAGLAAAVGQLANMGFTRDDESEADKLGFDFYCRAGWDPKKFGDFFETMVKKGLDTTPEYLSDHPSLAKRAKTADERAEAYLARGANKRKQPVADDRQFAQLQARAKQIGQNAPTDESLANSKALFAALPRSCLTPDQPNPPDAQAAQQQLIDKANREQAAEKKKQKN